MLFFKSRNSVILILILTLLPGTIVGVSARDNIYTLPGTGNKESQNEQKKNDRETKQNRENINKKNYLISIGMAANTKDAFLGFKAGMNIVPSYDVYLNLVYYFRPYKNTVFVKSDSDHYFQLKENRSVLGIGFEKHFRYDDFFGFYLNGGIGYTWSSYAGVEWEADEGTAPFAGGGPFLKFFDFLIVRFGYQYIRVPHVPDHRGVFSIDINI
jgi:hypothetical protein